jgi:phosphoenolpyruvate carboxylase
MRQSSDIHERVLAELFAKAAWQADYAGLSRRQGSAAAERTGAAAPAVLAVHQLLGRTVRTGVLRARRANPPRYGARDPQLHHLAHGNRVRPAGSAAAAKGKGLLRTAAQRGEHWT